MQASNETEGPIMTPKIEFTTPPGTMRPVGHYSHIAKVGDWITIGATAGVDPATGELAGPGVASQTMQILDAFEVMLATVGSDLDHVVHIHIFLKNMDEFASMDAAYAKRMGTRCPARTTVAVVDLPKPRACVTMNLTAVTSS